MSKVDNNKKLHISLNFLRIIIFIIFIFNCQLANAQRKSVPLNQVDKRFTIRAERHYAFQNEEYWFFIQNNTNEEYELVVDVTINSTCHPSKNFKLDVTNTVTLKPGGQFTPKSDWSHIFLGGSAQDACRKKDGDSYTYLAGISYSYSNIKNITQEKLKEEREKKLKEEQKALEKKKAEEQKIAEEKKKAEEQKIAEEKNKLEEQKALEKKKAEEQKALASKSTNDNSSITKKSDSFWSEGYESKEQDRKKDNAIPEQDFHKNLPDLVRTTDGGYYKRGEDGRFMEISATEYADAKKEGRNISQPQQEEPQMTSEEVMAGINKIVTDAKAQNEAIEARFEQKAEMWKQNYYHAEAIRNGTQNLAQISRLSGNYNSVAELEAEFDQKYSSVRYEVDNLEQARNAQLNNAVYGTFNENATEQAIGEGLVLIGTMINNAKAEKEAKAAQEALERQREQQLASIAAAKKRALVGLRTKLVTSFPNGGTPISAHKITAPEVYMFAYIIDPTKFENEIAGVSVTNVFSVQQYSDGTYPYKTSVLNKVKALGPGSITLVGYYTDKSKAEEMHKSFLNLAKKSSLIISNIIIKTPKSATTAIKNNGDFWETGNSETKKSTSEAPEKKEDDFWNN